MLPTIDGRKNLGTFWRGQDNNVYVAGDKGVNAAGVWDDNTSNYWMSRGFNLTADPNPGNKNSVASLPSIYGAGGGSRQVYAPKLDIAATNAKARAAAEANVNPYYTKVLGDFLSQQAAAKTRREQQYQTNVKNMDDQLANTLQDTELNRGRTTEDVATNMGEIAQTADEFQTDSGQEFDTARTELARTTSTGGLGRQKQAKLQEGRNVQETRQEQKFQRAREEQQLFKSRTFDDLAKTDTRAKEGNVKGKAQEKFDLDSYIENSVFEEKNKRNELEQERLQAIAREQGNQGKLLFNQYLAGIKDPAKLQAAMATYGGAF